MEILGKPSINPLLFISGKTCGYMTWIFLILEILKVNILPANSILILRQAALIIIVIGIFFLIISSINLGRSVRLGLPDTKTELKLSGVYRISRNPMYLGFNFVTLASMLYIFNVFVIILGLYSIIIYHFIILGEEKFLEQRFGSVSPTFSFKPHQQLKSLRRLKRQANWQMTLTDSIKRTSLAFQV